MAFPELGILRFSGQNMEAGPKVTEIQMGYTSPLGTCTRPLFLPITSMTLLLRTLMTASISWSPRSSVSGKKDRQRGRTWEFLILTPRSARFYLSPEKGSSRRLLRPPCSGLEHHSIWPVTLSHCPELLPVHHSCQGALWWVQSSGQRATGPMVPWSPWEWRMPQNDLKMIKCSKGERVRDQQSNAVDVVFTKNMPKTQNRNEREKSPTTLPSQKSWLYFSPVNIGTSGQTSFFPFYYKSALLRHTLYK